MNIVTKYRMPNDVTSDQGGFSVVETSLVILIVAAVASIGWWVYNQQSRNLVENTTSVNRSAQAVDASKVGTSSGIEQLTQFDSNSEEALSRREDTAEQTFVLTTNSADRSVGSSFDESAL